jgi:hypothetical protein
MRPLRELINANAPVCPLVVQWIAEAEIQVEVLPTDRAAGEATLDATQVTTRSPLGALASQTAGLFLDGGWLRLPDAGGPCLPNRLYDIRITTGRA